MKTLDEIISRNDYKRMTTQLRERTEEIACKIRDKMVELDLDDDEYEPLKGLQLKVVRGRTNVGSYVYLAYVQKVGYLNRWFCIDGGYSGYIHGDFNHRVETASNAQCLHFLNRASEILNWLDKVESEKADEISNALKILKDL